LKIHDRLGNVQGHSNINEARNHVVAQWAQGEGSKIMLAHTRADVKAMNASAREVMREQGHLKGEDVQVMTNDGQINLAQGEQIAFGKPNKQIGVVNGTRGTVQSIEQTKEGQLLNVQVGGDIKRVNLNEYSDIKHNYATTVHKSQGVTVDRAYVLASDSMSANLTYVASTRHKEELQIHYSKEQFKDTEEMGRKLSRAEEKTYSADYEILRDVKTLEKDKARETLSERREVTQKMTAKETMGQAISERQKTTYQEARERVVELDSKQQQEQGKTEMQNDKGMSHGL
jgi:ATP-dependent exoDNAse (exonuclease V) alpha subunit